MEGRDPVDEIMWLIQTGQGERAEEIATRHFNGRLRRLLELRREGGIEGVAYGVINDINRLLARVRDGNITRAHLQGVDDALVDMQYHGLPMAFDDDVPQPPQESWMPPPPDEPTQG